jgi:hypothetical protein
MDNRLMAARQSVIELVAADVTPLAPILPIVIPAYSPYPPALPQALITNDNTQDPFQGHTPTLWRDYPFQLVPQSLAVDGDGKPVTMDALWADPNASCWSMIHGVRLFDDQGEPSRYLQAVMQRLRQAQQEIERTRQLVGLLREAKALHLREITHRHETLSVFQVTTEGLADRLEALDADHAGYAMILAERIEASQVGLAFNVHSRA